MFSKMFWNPGTNDHKLFTFYSKKQFLQPSHSIKQSIIYACSDQKMWSLQDKTVVQNKCASQKSVLEIDFKYFL